MSSFHFVGGRNFFRPRAQRLTSRWHRGNACRTASLMVFSVNLQNSGTPPVDGWFAQSHNPRADMSILNSARRSSIDITTSFLAVVDGVTTAAADDDARGGGAAAAVPVKFLLLVAYGYCFCSIEQSLSSFLLSLSLLLLYPLLPRSCCSRFSRRNRFDDITKRTFSTILQQYVDVANRINAGEFRTHASF